MSTRAIDALQGGASPVKRTGQTPRGGGAVGNVEKPDFKRLLEKAQQDQAGLHLSKHVQTRLEQRDIQFDQNQLEQLKEAVNLAESKGIRDSLVLTDQAAYIVNVPNRVVVTAVGRGEAAQQVFTNIDGAVSL